MTATHAKERIALRYWLLGREWYRALDAFDYAETFHTGLRKDGITPEFNHQIQIAQYLTTLAPHLLHPEDTITVALLHDVCEDYDVEFTDIATHFGHRVCDATRAMTKTHKGVDRNPDEVKNAQAACPIASIVKGADRIHNQSTMVGVFGTAKINAYVTETEDYILPMLKTARRRFASQDSAYQNARLVLRTQNRTLRHFATSDEPTAA